MEKISLIEMLGIDDVIKKAYESGYLQRIIDESTSELNETNSYKESARDVNLIINEFTSKVNEKTLESKYNYDYVKELSEKYMGRLKQLIENKKQ